MAESAPVLGAGEPLIDDLNEAKKVEERAAEVEVAPVVFNSNVEVCAT